MCVCFTAVANAYHVYVCVLQGWPVPSVCIVTGVTNAYCVCVTGVASAYAITLVIVSWILDPGIKNEAKHVKL